MKCHNTKLDIDIDLDLNLDLDSDPDIDQITIDRQSFIVKKGEFSLAELPPHIANLKIYKNKGQYDKIVGFIYWALFYNFYNTVDIINHNVDYYFVTDHIKNGGYINVELFKKFSQASTPPAPTKINDIYYNILETDPKGLAIFVNNLQAQNITLSADKFKNKPLLFNNNDIVLILTEPLLDKCTSLLAMLTYKTDNIAFLIDFSHPNLNNNGEGEIDTIKDPNDNYGNNIRAIHQAFEKSHYSFYIIDGTSFVLFIKPHNVFYNVVVDYLTKYNMINDRIITYNNLLELCMIVKNAGDGFEDVLKHNLQFVDHWTIYDTGSTDNTINIIKKVTKEINKPGQLITENISIDDFNFATARNKCFDVAGQRCTFAIMLDDTYKIIGNIRGYMENIRADDFADTFSLFINTNDMFYCSNRIIKTKTKLRYKYRIHEVIDDKNNIPVVIDKEHIYIYDVPSKYMTERTIARKHKEIEWLNDEITINKFDPRAYYYLGQTYKLLGDFENAFKYFEKRIELKYSGFFLEYYDALFEYARIAEYQLKRPWDFCFNLYTKLIYLDENKIEPYYFIAIHYIQNNPKLAYEYLLKGFNIPIQTQNQFNDKFTIILYFLPLEIVKLAYQFNDFLNGFAAANRILEHFGFIKSVFNNEQLSDLIKDISVVETYYQIFNQLLEYDKITNLTSFNPLIAFDEDNSPPIPDTPIPHPVCIFIAEGGYSKWDGNSPHTHGLGGAETYCVEVAKQLAASTNAHHTSPNKAHNKYAVYIFCNTEYEDTIKIIDNVNYINIKWLYHFLAKHYVSHCIVNRCVHYLPVCYRANIENIYLAVHDVMPVGNVIVNHPKFRYIICMSEWQKVGIENTFPLFANKTLVIPPGIDVKTFYANTGGSISSTANSTEEITKVPYSFIFSSFPNRGLHILLNMWEDIKRIQSRATLTICCNLDNDWVNKNYPQIIKEIKNKLEYFKKKDPKNMYGINLVGWVNKKQLAALWLKSDIWFYPCVFLETYCITALECAVAKTFAISNGIGALQTTIGARGLIIEGEPTTLEWQHKALSLMTPYLLDYTHPVKIKLINDNFKWGLTQSWKKQGKSLAKLFNKTPYECNNQYSDIYDFNVPIEIYQQYMTEILSHCYNSDGGGGTPTTCYICNAHNGIGPLNFLQEMYNKYADFKESCDTQVHHLGGVELNVIYNTECTNTCFAKNVATFCLNNSKKYINFYKATEPDDNAATSVLFANIVFYYYHHANASKHFNEIDIMLKNINDKNIIILNLPISFEEDQNNNENAIYAKLLYQNIIGNVYPIKVKLQYIVSTNYIFVIKKIPHSAKAHHHPNNK